MNRLITRFRLLLLSLDALSTRLQIAPTCQRLIFPNGRRFLGSQGRGWCVSGRFIFFHQ